jgi:hypothetical protein
VLASFDLEAPTMRLNKSSNANGNEGPQQQLGGNNMQQNLEHIPLDALMSLQEVASSGRADTAALIAKFRPDRQSAKHKRLTDFCEKILAEIRIN